VVLAEPGSVDPAELREMSYVEHPENVAVVLEVARTLGIERSRALRAIVGASPDPGAACVVDLSHASGPWRLVNLFAANDPESTFQALDTVEAASGPLDRPLLLFAARGDRSARSAEFADVLPSHQQRFHKIVLYGERTRAMARKARRRGVDPDRIVDAGDRTPGELTDLLALWMPADRTVVGVGNIIGPAQRWLEHLGAEAELVDPAAVRAETSEELDEVPA
jgi:gamma-polyglutamate synthase